MQILKVKQFEDLAFINSGGSRVKIRGKTLCSKTNFEQPNHFCAEINLLKNPLNISTVAL